MPPNVTNPLAYENDDVELVPTFAKKGYRTYPILYVNGERVSEKLATKARPNQTLLSFLRDTLLLTGSKLGCAEGGCGACTVLISKRNKVTGSIQHITANACLMPVLAADGCHVTTVEGVGTVKGNKLHPLQAAMVQMHGSQCGYCTPGIIVSIYGLLANSTKTKHLEEHMDGNLCRCTGYRPIWDAARSLCDDAEEELIKGPCGKACRECPERDECKQDCNEHDKEVSEREKVCCSTSLDKVKEFQRKMEELDDSKAWTKQPDSMFPKELLETESELMAELSKPLMIVDKSDFHAAGTWVKPTTLRDMLALLKDFAGNCKIVVGNTEVGIETRFKHANYPRLIAPSESIESLFGFQVVEPNLKIGSCTPLSQIQHECDQFTGDPHLGKTVKPVCDMLRWFASSQIRNVACLGGNLVTASPISDMNPMLACMNATLTVASLSESDDTVKRRTIPVCKFFLRYRTVDLQPNEVLECVEVPITRPFEFVKPFKQARRREDDISIVSAGMRMRLAPKDDKWSIEEASLAYGGMAPTTVLAGKTAAYLVGREFSFETCEAAQGTLLEEMKLPADVPGGQASFRMTLAVSFLYKFFTQVVEEMKKEVKGQEGLPALPNVDSQDASAAKTYVDTAKPSITGVQTYPAPKVAEGLEEKEMCNVKTAPKNPDAVGKASPHVSGPLHCTGEALYTDDIPITASTLQGALIVSTECGGVLESLDIAPALEVHGVQAVYTYQDIAKLGGNNHMGPIIKDEFCFLPVGEKVPMVNQVLGVVVAETLESAETGARAVKAVMKPPEEKMLVSIEDAIEASSFYESTRHLIARGNQDVFAKLESTSLDAHVRTGDTVVVEGEFRCGGQDHFYLETNSTIAVPSESDTNLTVYCSTQAVTKTQKFCASTTNTPESKVVVRMKRMGGGFGGKETRSVFASCAAAVAAKLSGKPVRVTLPRDLDMSITGGRHAFLAKYKASGVKTETSLKLDAIDIKLFNNGGCGLDLSGPVMDRALFHVEAVYDWPNFRAEGVVCRTCQPPHTAFRGFGGPQGMAAGEHVIEHLANACGVSVDVVRRDNMFKTGAATSYGMILGEQDSGKWNVPSMWDRLYIDKNVAEKRAEIEKFNKKSRWVKRGLGFLPTKFGIAFTAKLMNQGGALVHVYTDGTILVSHGGTEMGQGLHTKVCQVAAQAFAVPLDHVYVNDTSSDKVANTHPTAASMSTDLYGMATLDACRQILERIQPVRERLGPEATLAEVATAAFVDRIDLSAHGYFRLADSRCGFNWSDDKPEGYPDDKPENSWKGHPFNYFTQGVACTEVEIDVLTGNHRTISADLIVDVGSSINPTIDIGQIEGAFAQGMGWSTIEEVVYSDDDHTWIRPRGKTFTTGPGTYKIPSFNDVPEQFNVSLLEDVDNPFAVHSSKAIGEPPFFLGASVFYAIKDAVKAARAEQLGHERYFELRMPATSERIRMLCGDKLVQKALQSTLPFRDGREPTRDVDSFQPQGSH